MSADGGDATACSTAVLDEVGRLEALITSHPLDSALRDTVQGRLRDLLTALASSPQEAGRGGDGAQKA
ncbi:hypothetical protein ACZ90_64155 [Streptomyces albus subsp. albus]|nr:hypothetical protein ACZ90_64155 [Streptomyces albus subsp. albus]